MGRPVEVLFCSVIPRLGEFGLVFSSLLVALQVIVALVDLILSI
jgi:hypothetical protein